MTLYIIGLGLNDEKDITVKGLETVKKCDFVYLENYTSILTCSVNDLKKMYGKEVTFLDRAAVENRADEILEKAKNKKVAFLVVGDPLLATTHTDLLTRAKEKEIETKIIHNASIFSAVAMTGLQLYKFGKTASVPFPEKSHRPITPYEVLKLNQKNKLHTLLLLDLRPEENKFMTVNEAIQYLLDIEKEKDDKVITEDTLCIGCARLGSDDFVIKSGKSSKIVKEDFGKAPHCLIVPGELHFMEEEFLEQWKV